MINTHAKYTIVLDTLLNEPEAAEKINKALSTYPLYKKQSKEEYIPSVIPTREELNKAILNHYRFREIGSETFGRFLFELETAMCEIMPYYNQLMFTQDQDFNIIYNVDYKKTIDTNRSTETDTKATDEGNNTIKGIVKTNTETTDKSKTEASVDTNNKTVNSKTPQNELKVPASDIDSVKYADDVSWNKGNNKDVGSSESSGAGKTNTDNTETTTTTGKQNATSNMKGTEGTVETTKGNFGVVSAQDLVLKYRETILNIVQMIIKDNRIEELFMLVY